MGVVKAYLITYNLFLASSWVYVLIVALGHLLNGVTSDNNDILNVAMTRTPSLYASVAFSLQVAQTLAVMEVLHAVIRLTKSPWHITFQQVLSRLTLVWAICYSVPAVQSQGLAFTLMLSAWTVTEIIRYLYYAFHLMGYVPYVLLWCRYTFFYLLYPIGVTGELLMIYHALPHVKKDSLFSYPLPNPINFHFDFYYALIFVMLVYVPAFPQLYVYMINQRKKVLGRASYKTKKNK